MTRYTINRIFQLIRKKLEKMFAIYQMQAYRRFKYIKFARMYWSAAGVVVSCKIPILATRVRFPGGANFLLDVFARNFEFAFSGKINPLKFTFNLKYITLMVKCLKCTFQNSEVFSILWFHCVLWFTCYGNLLDNIL